MPSENQDPERQYESDAELDKLASLRMEQKQIPWWYWWLTLPTVGLFIRPMWSHESERIGKQKCTPIGYAMHEAAWGIGFFGLLLVFVITVLLIRNAIVGTFTTRALWGLALAYGLGVISMVLHRLSWQLAEKRRFHYDYERCEASWIEDGQRRSYKWASDQH